MYKIYNANQQVIESVGGTIGDIGKPTVLPCEVIEAIINKEIVGSEWLKNPYKIISKNEKDFVYLGKQNNHNE